MTTDLWLSVKWGLFWVDITVYRNCQTNFSNNFLCRIATNFTKRYMEFVGSFMNSFMQSRSRISFVKAIHQDDKITFCSPVAYGQNLICGLRCCVVHSRC
jgi:hypothetical protein